MAESFLLVALIQHAFPKVTEENRKRVLFICYFFPPVGAGGVFRALKFAKYLPQFGWDPTVLTVKPMGAWVTDETLLEQVNCEVVSTGSFHPVGKFRKWKDEHPKASPVLKECLKWLGETLPGKLMVPDTRAGWIPFAIAKALWLHMAKPYDLILTNSPPHSTHAIGLSLKKITGLPWIADFKDGWLHDPYRLPQSHLREQMESAMERCIARNVDHLITISRPLADYFEDICSSEISVIPNGFDEADFQANNSPKLPEVTIGYFGAIFGDRDPTNFLRGVERYVESHPNKEPRIIFVGPVDLPSRKKIETFDHLDVEIIPYLSHQECLELMSSCHALLTLVGNDPRNDGVLTGKIFEYLRSGVPILATCPKEGALWEFLKPVQHAFTSTPENIETIAEAVDHAISFSKKPGSSDLHPDMKNFERKNLTGKLADIFNLVTVKEKG